MSKRHLGRLSLIVQTVVACAVFLVPMAWMLLSSLKPSIGVAAYPPTLRFTPTLENYDYLFRSADLLRYLMNSIIVAAGSTALGLVLALPAAFAISWHRVSWPASLVLFTRMAPGTLFVLPWFVMFTGIGLIGSHSVLVLTHTVITVPLILWVLTPYFDQVPRSLFESAFIDGSSPMGCLARIGIPLVLPGIVVASILAFINSWNYFLFALILGNVETTTLIVLSFHFIGEGSTNWGALMAAAVIIAAPPVLMMFVVQRGLISGLTGGAVKQ